MRNVRSIVEPSTESSDTTRLLWLTPIDDLVNAATSTAGAGVRKPLLDGGV